MIPEDDIRCGWRLLRFGCAGLKALAPRRLLFFSGPAYTGPDALVLGPHLIQTAGGDVRQICYVPTATGDNPARIAGFYEAVQPFGLKAVHVSVIRSPGPHIRDLVMGSEIVYVDGGNTAAMLVLWRRFEFHEILREAWESGILLSGHSAGAICWFEAYMSDSLAGTKPFDDGLGWLEGSACTHYDSQPGRQEPYRNAVAKGFRAGFAMEDGTGLYVEETKIVEAITARPGAVVRRIELRQDGDVAENPLEMRSLVPTSDDMGAQR